MGLYFALAEWVSFYFLSSESPLSTHFGEKINQINPLFSLGPPDVEEED